MEKATIRGIALALLIGAVMLPWFTLSQATTIEDDKHKQNSKEKLVVGPDRIVTSQTSVVQTNDDVATTESGTAAAIRTDAEAVDSLLGTTFSRAIVFFAQIRFLLLISLALIMTDFLFGDRLEGKDAILSIAATACIGLAVALFLVGGADAIQDGTGRVLAQDVSCEEGNQDDLERCDKRIEFKNIFGSPDYEYDVDTYWGGSDDSEVKEIVAKESASWRPASGFLLAVLACVAMVLTLLGSDPEKAAERNRLKEEKKAAKAAAAAAAAAAIPPVMPGVAAAPMPGAAAAPPPLPADAPPAPMAPATGAAAGYPPIPPPS